MDRSASTLTVHSMDGSISAIFSNPSKLRDRFVSSAAGEISSRDHNESSIMSYPKSAPATCRTTSTVT
eukprot:CAMPEP_0174898710 /NCGR_PEP_ID=MMETSP0167-20121228/23285_1 /TAXON_ID=38298 /ORGANISM="Rhodella maculata, Strain CCMP736" /LENGTH=67 /DNA_ID=CAMNT_0016139421 /DNA_START=104 /DNA_END=307 /DNA_ORIENTATION=+